MEQDWRREYQKDDEHDASSEGDTSRMSGAGDTNGAEEQQTTTSGYYMPPEDEEPTIEVGGHYYSNATPYTPISEPARPESSSGYGIASLILGILSLCCCGLPAGIAAIVTAVVDKNKRGGFSGYAVAGLILGILGLISWLMGMVLLFALYLPLMEDILNDPEYYTALPRFFL